jgi:hypothetical protein
MRGIFTSMPATVSEDGDGHTASAQPTINQLVRQDDGTMQQTPWPSLKTMPVHFSGGGKMVSTHPVKAKDEGILVFASRALDSWHQSGGPQNPIDARQHSASDGFYLGGIKSDPNKIPNYGTDSIQHRSLDAKTTHDVHPTNGITTKVVPASDSSTNPFANATTFFQTLHNAVSGIAHSAVASGITHAITLDHTVGPKLTANNNAHVVNVNPSSGIALTTAASIVHSAQQNITETAQQSITNSAPLISLLASTAISLSAPSLTMPSGTAAANVGTLGGDLSGTLPNPTVVGVHLKPLTVATLPSASPGGQLCYVTDATSLTNGSAVAGGGSQQAIVKSNGITWVVLG